MVKQYWSVAVAVVITDKQGVGGGGSENITKMSIPSPPAHPGTGKGGLLTSVGGRKREN